jgi:hypothetical protein
VTQLQARQLDVDTTAADVLFDLDRLLDERGQTLLFAELKDPVRRKVDRYGLTREIEPRHFFPTVEAAADAWCPDRCNLGRPSRGRSCSVGRRSAAEVQFNRQAVGAPRRGVRR